MSFFSFSTPSLIGLDIKPDGARLVQLKKKKQRYRAENVGMAALPQGVFEKGKVQCWDILSTTLGGLVASLGLKGCPVVINLPAELVSMQRMQVPVGLKDKDIKAEIESHLHKDLPDKSVPLCIDFNLRQSADPYYLDVFYVAAPGDYLSDLIRCVNATGLQTKIVDVDIYALKRAAHFALSENTPDKTHALVSVLNEMAILIVFNAQEIIFYQQWQVKEKGDFITQIKSRMQVCLASFHQLQIRKLLLFATQNYFAPFLEDLTPSWAYPVFSPDPFKQIELSAQVEACLRVSQPGDFLMACGAAMRSVPRW